ncbi:MAG: hypothetical protein HYZ73_03180 [Elusimicrobia bacterium]|nr:hypothetical protein [Elusimicrobiota bacterium]
MKKSILGQCIAVALVMPTVGLFAAEHPTTSGHEHPTAPSQTQVKAPATSTPATVQGEILDMVCYMDHGEKGAKHKACAEKCIKGGAPVGLLTADGAVYLLLEDHNAPAPYQTLKGMAAEQVTVQGTIVNRGGVQGLVVKSMNKAKA